MDSHRVRSGRVTIFVGRVGSGLEIWNRVQLCCGLMLNIKRSSMASYRANILTVIDDYYEKYFPINRTAAMSMQSADSTRKMH